MFWKMRRWLLHLKRACPPFKRLYWKLALSYMLVTVAVLTVLQIMGVLSVVWYFSRSTLILTGIESGIASLAVQAGYFLNDSSSKAAVEDAILTPWLREQIPPQARGSAYTFFQVSLPNRDQFPSASLSVTDGDLAVIIGASGSVLAANEPEAIASIGKNAAFIDPLVPVDSQRIIEQALNGAASSTIHDDRSILIAQPIWSRENNASVVGVLYVRLVSFVPVKSQLILNGLYFLGISIPIFAVLGSIIGMGFGFFTARRFARRLGVLTAVADAWGQGDFSVVVHDRSLDEIGQLARQMNCMARQVRNQMQTREQLATLGARNQLARDLHDSVKQQVFAVTMTLGAAQTLKERDPEAAWSGVSKALDLSIAAQQELAALVRELRPLTLEEAGLPQALREQVESWSNRMSIPAGCQVEGEGALPWDVEEALFRVTQEALANVARHSDATRADVILSYDDGTVTLTITDDGCGFDAAAVRGKGLGLRSMRERVEAIGGAWHVERLDRGTRIEIRAPISPAGGGVA